MKFVKAAVFLLISSSLMAQFASKKDEKFYYKLDDAYLDYDYTTILDNEEKATETFLSSEDTVAANACDAILNTWSFYPTA